MQNLVVVSGAPGSGKSTALHALATWFEGTGRTVRMIHREASAELLREVAGIYDAVVIDGVGDPGSLSMACVERVAAELPRVRFYVATERAGGAQ